jgi:hypothetical protein
MNSRATLGIERSTIARTKCLGFEFNAWDLGGQQQFRQDYMKKKLMVFTNVHSLFYVFDIQDSKRFRDSLDYLKSILVILESLGENPKISILFHKDDPDLVKDRKHKDQVKQLEKLVRNTVRSFKFNIFNTSIHDFPTILAAFSEGVIKGSPKGKILNEFLKTYAKATFSSAVLLLNEDLLIIGSHQSHEKYLKLCQTVAPRLITAMEKMPSYDVRPLNLIINVEFDSHSTLENILDDSKEYAFIFVRNMLTESGNYSVVTLSRNKSTLKLSDEHLPKLAEQVLNLMEMIV